MPATAGKPWVFLLEDFFFLGSWDRSWKGLKEWKVWFGGDCEGLECTEGAFCLQVGVGMAF